MAVDLSAVTLTDILAELQHRVECTLKPEKRIVLVGECDGRSRPDVVLPPCHSTLGVCILHHKILHAQSYRCSPVCSTVLINQDSSPCC
jgi:hypothetical protein